MISIKKLEEIGVLRLHSDGEVNVLATIEAVVRRAAKDAGWEEGYILEQFGLWYLCPHGKEYPIRIGNGCNHAD